MEISCRIFPLFEQNGELKNDLRAVHICPLAAGNIKLEEYDREFIENTKKVFNVLKKFKVTKKYLAETQKIIDQYKII